jgi:hypothetical protein
MQPATQNLKKVSAIIAVCSVGLAIQAQLIDPLTGDLSSYTTTLVLDNSHGVSGASFTSGTSGLSVNFTGATSAPEQALLLAPVSGFSTTFAVGDRLTVDVAVPASGIMEDLGLAVAATTTPAAAADGNSWDARPLTDFATIYVRPSQNVVRGGDSISGTVNTGFAAGVGSTANITQLYIDWISTDVFTLGYVDTSSVSHDLYTATFDDGSTIGTAIGFYGDIRTTGTSIGTLSDLTVAPAPEPSTLALCGMGLAGLFAVARRKK